MQISKHAEQRFSQRGIRHKDLEICLAIGEYLGEKEFFISNKAADQAIREHKKRIKSIERVRNKKFVITDDHWVTAYCPGKGNMKKTLREGRGQGLRI